jgi:hypothetical protein
MSLSPRYFDGHVAFSSQMHGRGPRCAQPHDRARTH